MTNSIKSIISNNGAYAAVEIECHITNSLPNIMIIGYASRVVDEAKDRLRASFAAANYEIPKKRITINIAPADLQKDDPGLDLALAVSILRASKQINPELHQSIQRSVFIGELGLQGQVRSVKGIIGKILGAKRLGYSTIYIPLINLPQASLIPGVKLKPVDTLKSLVQDLQGQTPIQPVSGGVLPTVTKRTISSFDTDFSYIAGQSMAKRALEIAATGRHNILLYGPPGTGKSMLAKALVTILPQMTHDEILDVTHIHSLYDRNNNIVLDRPFRSPHHTASMTAIIGGGTKPKPGEVSLAHNGVLFMDEIPEFSKITLESLRQPLEDGFVTVARIQDTVRYPARFMLVATQNPCPCGFYGSNKPCTCSATQLQRYQQKLSGPIMDRIDLFVHVDDIAYSKIVAVNNEGEKSTSIALRVKEGSELQFKRLGISTYNSQMSNNTIRLKANITEDAKRFLDTAAGRLQLSARSYVRCLRVARTIADLDKSEQVAINHISEALQYRKPQMA